jgi:DNA repair protein SbcC/Rad50
VRLRHLRVKNIRSYESGALDFGAGTTLISGDVGAGKTSLLYAIEMALFGASEVDAAYLVRHGGAHAEVAVGFEDGEHRYEIARRFRRIRRKGRETFEPEAISFAVDGAKTEYSATELRQRVIELLGFPDNPNPTAHSDLWRWAVYVPQERMRDILAAKPQDRLETVRKALGVEKYRTAADNAQELGTDLRRTANALRSESELLRHFDEDHASASQEADQLRLERVALEEAIARREVAARAVRSEVEELDGAVRKADADGQEIASLRREDAADSEALDARTRVRLERIAGIEERRREADAARGEATALDGRKGALSVADAQRAKKRGELDLLSGPLRELHQARADLAGAERRLAPARRSVEHATVELATARAALERAVREGPSREPPAPTPETLAMIDRRLEESRNDDRSALAALTRAQASLHEFEELLSAGVCPRCGQTVRSSEFESHWTEATGQTQKAEAQYRGTSAELARIEEERRARERYERSLERWNQVERERTSARAAVSAAESHSGAAAETLAEAEKAVTDARSLLTRSSPAEEIEARIRSELAASESEHALLAARVEEALRSAERVRTARAAIEALAAEVARIDAETTALRRRAEERLRRIEGLGHLLEGAEERRSRLRDAEARRHTEEAAVEDGRRALVRIDTRLDGAVRRVTEAERGRAERARRVAEATELDAKAAWVSGPFRTAVLTMEQKLLRHAQVAFERNFTRYFATLIEDAALVARTDVAFTPAVAIEGEWTPAEALSGGERTSLALAFRLALAQVVRSLGSLRLDTILLDEPTDGFSPEQVVRMGELLDSLALPQVIIVSHEDALAGIADRVVRVVKVDGASHLRIGPSDPPVERSHAGSSSETVDLP